MGSAVRLDQPDRGEGAAVSIEADILSRLEAKIDRLLSRRNAPRRRTAATPSLRPITTLQAQAVEAATRHGWNLQRAADELGISRQSLSERVRAGLAKLRANGVEVAYRAPRSRVGRLRANGRGAIEAEHRSAANQESAPGSNRPKDFDNGVHQIS